MGKNWFISGTSSGFGRGLTEKLLARGDKVYATLRKPELLHELQQKYSEQLYLAHLELTDREEIRSVVNDAFSKLGRIDVMVSNAGYGLFGAVEELTEESIENIIDVNLLGSIYLVRAFIPYLRKQENGGRIIQISSEGGQYTYPGFSLYHASKWGIEGFIESIAKDLKELNIRFTIAEPGPTSTNFAAGLVIAEPIDAYENTAVNEVRKYIDTGFGSLDKAETVIDAIIDAADKDDDNLRVAIGEVAKNDIQTALKERLEDIRFVG